MDDELKRVRREALEAPDDVGAALRLASVAERVGSFAEAWTAIMRHVRPEDDETLVALRGLAARNPAPLVAYLRKLEDEHARFSCATLARIGERLPLVVVACDRSDEPGQLHARIALRPAAARIVPGLLGVDPLSVYSSPGRDWARFVLRHKPLYDRYPEEVMFLELSGHAASSVSTPTGVEVVATQMPTRAALPVSIESNAREEAWLPVARLIVERARAERRFELLPWLVALAGARVTAVASEAVVLFQELTGRLAPPLDPEDLSRRWVR